MVAIVVRAASKLGKKPVDLLPLWQKEVNRAMKENYGEQDSRTFLIAAENFLKKVKVNFSIDDLTQ